MNNQTTAAPAAMQEQQQKLNVQDEPTAESGFTKPAEAAFEHPAGGGSAPSPCSALGVSDKQSLADYDSNYSVDGCVLIKEGADYLDSLGLAEIVLQDVKSYHPNQRLIFHVVCGPAHLYDEGALPLFHSRINKRGREDQPTAKYGISLSSAILSR